MLEITKDLDYHGRKKRQRKQRTIKIDDREDRDGLTALLLSGMGYTVEKARLPLGDYSWESPLGLVLVERKTPKDARDFDRDLSQIKRLREVANIAFPILLIDHRAWSEDPLWENFALDNLLLSVQGTIRVAHCTQGQLAHRLDSLYQWSMKNHHTFMEE